MSTKAQIVFSHGNSFTAATYNVMLQALQDRGFEVLALEKFGHNPRYPVTNNWQPMTQELVDFCAKHPPAEGQARYLVGHSMGGILSLMAAAQHPQLAQALVLLDSPVLAGWRAAFVRYGKRTPWLQRYSPGRVSQRRRNEWPDLPAVQRHFASKALFANWHPQALHDYIHHGTRPEPSPTEPQRHTLAFDRKVETDIYNTLPDHVEPLLRRHPLQIPAAYIGGTESREMRQVGLALTRRITQNRIYLLPGGTHLFPMEQPEKSADMVVQALKDMGQ
ncbi:MAG: alpha/beta hydrolase [Brachymonas sp.]|nr:alpha/beta hydrolase [Brachymonas sp.]